ncbi:unnamed protein product [Candidula unifasciata]|uniref:EF-hand domain-containing protein n=1 Tax=Candidula unifasciata TaxID=100452 RepID=A0A8S3ZMP0_9EUPU|nr:unnamed protein product [Candidula unifasciata]
MLLYACLILLPTAAMAVCDRTVILAFYDAADTNGDGNIGSSEVTAVVTKIDGNSDQIVTRQELRDRLYLVAPNLVGQDAVIFDFFDTNGSGTLTSQDFTILYLRINTDFNTNISRQELITYLNRYC